MVSLCPRPQGLPRQSLRPLSSRPEAVRSPRACSRGRAYPLLQPHGAESDNTNNALVPSTGAWRCSRRYGVPIIEDDALGRLHPDAAHQLPRSRLMSCVRHERDQGTRVRTAIGIRGRAFASSLRLRAGARRATLVLDCGSPIDRCHCKLDAFGRCGFDFRGIRDASGSDSRTVIVLCAPPSCGAQSCKEWTTNCPRGPLGLGGRKIECHLRHPGFPASAWAHGLVAGPMLRRSYHSALRPGPARPWRPVRGVAVSS